MSKVTDICRELAAPFVTAAGCTLWDVEYVREGATWYLRVFIDAPDGVTIDQCEAVSRPLSDALDEADPIADSYVLEVSSAGVGRSLKKPEHFAAFLGSEVDLKFYQPRSGKKELTGTLKDYRDGEITVEIDGTPTAFAGKDLASVRLHVTF